MVCFRISCAALALANKDLLGTHPVHVQSPPSLARSMRRHRFFKVFEANFAAVRPADPPPITIKSNGGTVIGSTDDDDDDDADNDDEDDDDLDTDARENKVRDLIQAAEIVSASRRRVSV